MKIHSSFWLVVFSVMTAFLPLSAQTWQPVPGHLMTHWATEVSPEHPLPEYPRPQMTRKDWQTLNGLWDYALTDHAATTLPEKFAGKILVPFAYESALSGVGKPSVPDQRLWYRRTFTVPAGWKGQRLLLHFGAINWASTVAVNGTSIGSHKGGYSQLTYDVTDALKTDGGANELVVSAWNPLTDGTPDAQIMGKQRAKPVSVLYTAASGIWQTVWLEPVPAAAHIASLKLTPDLDARALRVTVDAGNMANTTVRLTATDQGKPAGAAEGKAGEELRLPITNVHPWTPDDPHLYDLQITLLQNGRLVDFVGSYFALRKISLGKDEQGHAKLFLNNGFVFQRGVLDQGYWPDGIYTAPTDEALAFDLRTIKKFGFNMERKHAKVEPDRMYYYADKLGLLVWQDMPQMFFDRGVSISDANRAQFKNEWREIIAQLSNHPCIVAWSTFNEDWGLHDIADVVAFTRQLDPSRLIDANTGGRDEGQGDFKDVHDYPGPACPPAEANRAVVNGEFGGIGRRVEGHMWGEGVFTYEGLAQSAWKLTQRYQNIWKKVYQLRDDKALSAVVYTQITDVEIESNGLLTYDRAVVKVLPDIVTAANEDRFPSLPPNPDVEVVPTSAETATEWRYTTEKPADGWQRPDFNDAVWQEGKAPFGQGISGTRTDWKTDDIWIRRTVTLPTRLPDKMEFSVMHDEDVEIYLNGALAASVPGYKSDYVRLPISAGAAHELRPGGTLLIAAHCHQTIGGQVIDVGIVPAK